MKFKIRNPKSEILKPCKIPWYGPGRPVRWVLAAVLLLCAGNVKAWDANTIQQIGTATNGNIPVFSANKKVVDTGISASGIVSDSSALASISNSYVKVSGGWKGSGFNYYFTGITNSRPVYEVSFSYYIGGDKIYFDGTKWVSVQSAEGTLFFDYSDGPLPHHSAVGTGLIPPSEFLLNTNNEYGAGTMYVQFVSGAEAALEEEGYREQWNQIRPLMTNSTVNGEPFVAFGTDGRPQFYTSGLADGYFYSGGYWYGHEGSDVTRIMTSRSWLPPRVTMAAYYAGTSAIITNAWESPILNLLELAEDKADADLGDLTKSTLFIKARGLELQYDSMINDRPSWSTTNDRSLSFDGTKWVYFDDALLYETFYNYCDAYIPVCTNWVDSSDEPAPTFEVYFRSSGEAEYFGIVRSLVGNVTSSFIRCSSAGFTTNIPFLDLAADGRPRYAVNLGAASEISVSPVTNGGWYAFAAMGEEQDVTCTHPSTARIPPYDGWGDDAGWGNFTTEYFRIVPTAP